MTIPTDEELLQQIEAFLDATGMTPTRLGLDATGEGGLIKSIRDGRSITLRTGRRLLDYMDNYCAGDTASPGISDTKSPSAQAVA
jgi:hypothetical protein